MTLGSELGVHNGYARGLELGVYLRSTFGLGLGFDEGVDLGFKDRSALLERGLDESTLGWRLGFKEDGSTLG